VITIQEPIAILRSLNGPAARCLLALLMSDQPLPSTRLAQLTQSSRSSIISAMQVLADLGFAERASPHSGWRLTPGAIGMFLAERPQGEVVQPAENAGGVAIKVESEPQANRAERAISTPVVVVKNNLESKITSTTTPITDSGNSQEISGEEVTEATLDADVSILGPRNPESRHHQRVNAVLNATPLLFGERILGPASRYPDLDLLLAWIAECYTHPSGLRKPARVVYSNLKHGRAPQEHYLHDPLAHLPTRFLQKAGLPVPEDRLIGLEGDGQPPSGESDETDLHRAGPEPPPHASLVAPLENASGRTPAQIWELILQSLRDQMPVGVYRRWVQPASLVAYNSKERSFLVAAQDEDSRLWLEDRLGRTLERGLQGFCGPGARVDFVGPVQTGG
jgi:hypothetical protein